MEAQTITPRYEFRLQQTSKGYWYVERLGIHGEVQEWVLSDMKRFAIECMKMLEEMNKTTTS